MRMSGHVSRNTSRNPPTVNQFHEKNFFDIFHEFFFNILGTFFCKVCRDPEFYDYRVCIQFHIRRTPRCLNIITEDLRQQELQRQAVEQQQREEEEREEQRLFEERQAEIKRLQDQEQEAEDDAFDEFLNTEN